MHLVLRSEDNPFERLVGNTRFVAGRHFKSFSDKTPAGSSFKIWKIGEEHLGVRVDGQRMRKYRIHNGNDIHGSRRLLAYLTKLCQIEEPVAKA